MTSEAFGLIYHWIRYGPRDRCGLIEFLVGHWLWWRLWAMGLFFLSPVYAGWLLLEHFEAPFVVVVTAVFGIFAGKWVLRVSPKYTVEENY